jgi:hypothetical protein
MTLSIASTPETDPRGESPTMFEIEKEERIEELKQAFIEDEISEQEFDILLDAAFDNDAPFRADWFMKQPESRRKRYAERDIYVYFDKEYEVKGEIVVPADVDEKDRVIKARDSDSLVTADFAEVEESNDVSEEVREKQDELREKLNL